MFRGQRSRNHLCSHNGWLPFTLAIDIGLQCVFKLIGDTNIVNNSVSNDRNVPPFYNLAALMKYLSTRLKDSIKD